ncbi:MAG: lipoyl(octanoyl) transferase LipB [Actinomycetaceae bacterium]|nr:lipoyl(octanoyl) transferase LipB [Actinomycetaceae bacterium]
MLVKTISVRIKAVRIIDMTSTGLIPYSVGDRLQRDIHRRVVDGEEDTLIFLHHEPTFTAGRATKPEDIPDSTLPVVSVDRGGSVTWHGPGQLVVYPIIRLREPIDVLQYIMALQRSVIDMLKEAYNLDTCLVRGRSGVWMCQEGEMDRKLCALGVKQAQAVTMHGIALNVNPDVSNFHRIIPCGLFDAGVTTLQQLACVGPDTSVSQLVEPLADKMTYYLQRCQACVQQPAPWPPHTPMMYAPPSEKEN